MKRVFEKVRPDSRIIIGYSASLLLLLIVYIVTLYSNRELKHRTAMVEHTYKTIFDLETLLSTVKDAETGVRGYALTHDTDFLAPYINSRPEADSIHKELLVLTKDNPVQQQRLGELRAVIKKRFEIFALGLNYYKNGATDTSYKLRAAQLESKRVMDKLRRGIAFMQKEENHLLAERDIALKSKFSSINTITIVSLLLTLLLVLIGFVTYTGENKARKIALQNIKEYQDQLGKRIDELNKANTQLLQMRSMEKFAATGRIARTIAHEVRNPLTNINLAAGQLKNDILPADENINYLFDVIDRNSNRINKLISDLLISTKFSELNFSSTTASKLLDETLYLAKDRIDLNKVKVEKDYKAHSSINIDFEKMKIAFLNIIINAIEAMEPESGILKISTKKEGSNCIITIADNGVGMDEVSLSKLFEPYFTNKPNGNGLGLANTQNIIFNHKGIISVTSEVGKGTMFIITLEEA
ncbi:MAG: CHASE3 domain-containing protein [Chitinophagaceae bacterium]|nr:CHASE3 domain-containing protein [Chitinophagaceae bacterium]